MAYRVAMFLLGLSEEFSFDVFNVLVAVWFMAVGYLLFKNVNRRMHARASRLAAPMPAESFLDAGQEQIFQRG